MGTARFYHKRDGRVSLMVGIGPAVDLHLRDVEFQAMPCRSLLLEGFVRLDSFGMGESQAKQR